MWYNACHVNVDTHHQCSPETEHRETQGTERSCFLLSPRGGLLPAGISVFIPDRAPAGLRIYMALNLLLLTHRNIKDFVKVVFRHFVIYVSA